MHINILLPTSLNKTLKYDEEPTQDMFEFDISQGAQCWNYCGHIQNFDSDTYTECLKT